MRVRRSAKPANSSVSLPRPGPAAKTAAAEGLSLRAYLARPADTLLTPTERAERAEQARAVPNASNGCAPTPAEQDDLDAELDRRQTQGMKDVPLQRGGWLSRIDHG